MLTLLDAPADDVVRLLRTVARAYHEADRQWPMWQYVLWAADQQQLDADQVVRSLPTWQYRYTYMFSDRGMAGGGWDPAARVGLTAAGMFHANDVLCNLLLEALVGALCGVEQHLRGIQPHPQQISHVVLDGGGVTALALQCSGVPVEAAQLREQLRREPATWSGIDLGQESDSWSWDLSRARLARYRGVRTGADYLARLEEVIGHQHRAASRPALPPTALADAIDHTNLLWKDIFKKPLLTIKNASVVARLAQPASCEDEFAARCSELAIVFSWLDTARRADKQTGQQALGTLAGLQELLRAHLGDDSPAVAAVDVLRDIAAIRTAQQHHERQQVASAAKVRLGLARLQNDWLAAWELTRHHVVDALRIVRDEVAA